MPRTPCGTSIASGPARSTWKRRWTGGRRSYHSTGRITRSAPWEAPAMSLSKKIAAEVDDLVKTCAPPLCVGASEGAHKIDLPVSLATAVGVECEGFDFHVNDRAELPLA